MSKLPPYRSDNAMVRALLGDFAAPPHNAMRELSSTYPSLGLLGDYPAPPPTGLLPYPATVPTTANYLRDAMMPYPPQPPFECKLKEAAWIRTAGHVDAPNCVDEENVFLERNAPKGSPTAWNAAHIIDAALGGSDHPSNMRALNESSNKAQGARLGNAMKRYRG